MIEDRNLRDMQKGLDEIMDAQDGTHQLVCMKMLIQRYGLHNIRPLARRYDLGELVRRAVRGMRKDGVFGRTRPRGKQLLEQKRNQLRRK
ncbi:MAG: hypothetical protein PHD95_07075 [Candidatus ainarchaeum sp.]|nr:hypothetical protein [Candidatus ainarchaeum sp.]